MTFEELGAAAFGVVIGWITYRTLRRREGSSALSDIATVIGAVGGASVLALFKTPDLFASYSMGLFLGFFLYLIVSLLLPGSNGAKNWMGD